MSIKLFHDVLQSEIGVTKAKVEFFITAYFTQRNMYASFKYARAMQLPRRKSLEKERENKNTEQPRFSSENYTIFHASVEIMVKKDKDDSRRRRFLRKLKLSK